MESRGPEDSKNVKTSQAYFFEGFISFFEDFSLTIWGFTMDNMFRYILNLCVILNHWNNLDTQTMILNS